jgi:hypothetical protein
MGGRKQKFKPLKPGIIILGEGLTEHYYFRHLKSLFHYHYSVKPRFFCNTCAEDFEKKIEESLRGDITIICVFDGDVPGRNREEGRKFARLKEKYEGNTNVVFCESLPSIEFWFLIHYQDTCRHFASSEKTQKTLRKFITNYEKTEDFLKNLKWVKEMSIDVGSLESAISRAARCGMHSPSHSNLHEAFLLFDESRSR